MNKHKKGDTLEVSLWYNSEKTTESGMARSAISRVLDETCKFEKVYLTPVEYEDLELGDERVPEPPKEFAGTPRLMLGFATVVGIRQGFITQ